MIYAAGFEDKKTSNNVLKEQRDILSTDAVHFTQTQHDMAWRLFEYALKKEYDIELHECIVEYNRYGKPFLREYPDLYFSISHCKGFAVCVLSDNEVGIDAETVGRSCKASVWKRVLSDSEYGQIMNIADKAERDIQFLRYWTLKESYGKAIGRGLLYDYKAVIFSTEDTIIASNLPDYRLWQTVIKYDYKEIVVSVCKKQTEAFGENIEWVILDR